MSIQAITSAFTANRNPIKEVGRSAAIGAGVGLVAGLATDVFMPAIKQGGVKGCFSAIKESYQQAGGLFGFLKGTGMAKKVGIFAGVFAAATAIAMGVKKFMGGKKA